MTIIYKIRPGSIGKLFSGDAPPDDFKDKRRMFPYEIPVVELERGMQEAFGSVGKYVVSDYFIEGSEHYPKNLEFVIYATDEVKNGALAGGLVATREKIDSIEVIYYDKIFVVLNYQRNGVGENLVNLARMVSPGKGILPSVLRCGEEVNGFYVGLSDISNKENGYVVHGFGFIDKKMQQPLFKNAEEIFYDYLVGYIAQKPATTFKKT